MDTYDPDLSPDPQGWLAQTEQQRISAAIGAHEGRFPDALHTEGANPLMHGSLHAIVETQIASGSPEITAQTVIRLCEGGLKRHAAVHAVMQILARHLSKLGGEDARFDRDAWTRELTRLTAGEALGQALQGAQFGEVQPASGPNRAQRRAAKKKGGS